MKQKKAEFGTGLVVLIVLIVIGIFYAYSVISRQCNSDGDCGNGNYCGSDFSCHQFPNAVELSPPNYIIPSLIIGISLIICTAIIKGWFTTPVKKDDHHDDGHH